MPHSPTPQRCGHRTPDGPCRHQVAAAARCAAGHPAAPTAATTAPVGLHTAAVDPFAASRNVPNPQAADAATIAAYEDSDAYGHVQFVGFDPDDRETFHPDDLTANQADLDEATVAWHQANPSDEPIMVLRAEGHAWIYDGNHRVEAARREGRTIDADVMNLDLDY